MSQCDRVLAVLRDHLPHRMEEIHQRAGTMRLNSRISELRRRGHNIVCDKAGGVYTYRLLREPDGGAGSLSSSGSLSGPVRESDERNQIGAGRSSSRGLQDPSKGGSGVSAVSPDAAHPTQLTVWSEAAA